MKLVVGLGNLGKEYNLTRHNVGFMFVDYIAKKNNIDICKEKTKYIYGEGIINGEKVSIIKPNTYMNLSGEAIVQAKNWYKVENDNIIVVYDDVDIPLGDVRYREFGSAGTHNGMRNIVENLSTQDIHRIRIGIENRDNKNQDLANYVLAKFKKEEIELLEKSSFEEAEKKLSEYLSGKVI